MTIQEIRSLTDEQLKQELERTQRELMNLRFSAATNQLPDSNQPRLVRRSIARLLTVTRERELVEG